MSNLSHLICHPNFSNPFWTSWYSVAPQSPPGNKLQDVTASLTLFLRSTKLKNFNIHSKVWTLLGMMIICNVTTYIAVSSKSIDLYFFHCYAVWLSLTFEFHGDMVLQIWTVQLYCLSFVIKSLIQQSNITPKRIHQHIHGMFSWIMMMYVLLN